MKLSIIVGLVAIFVASTEGAFNGLTCLRCDSVSPAQCLAQQRRERCEDLATQCQIFYRPRENLVESRCEAEPCTNELVSNPEDWFRSGHICRDCCFENMCTVNSFCLAGAISTPEIDTTPPPPCTCGEPEVWSYEDGDVECSNSTTSGRYEIKSTCEYKCPTGYSFDDKKTKDYSRVCLPVDLSNPTGECHWTPALPGDCQKDCINRDKLDLAFLLDESDSVKAAPFGKMLDAVKLIIKDLKIGNEDVRVSTTYFSTVKYTETPHALKDTIDLNELNEELTNKQYNGHPATDMGRAFNHILDKVYTTANGDRSNVPNVMIMMTDGDPDFAGIVPKDNGKPNFFAPGVARLQQSNVIVYVIRIGKSEDFKEGFKYINQIVMKPKPDNPSELYIPENRVHTAEDFDKLLKIIPGFIQKVLCP